MDRKSFIEMTKEYLEAKVLDSVKPKDLEICLYGLVECLIRVVESGDEVRLTPFGTFFPRIIYKPGTKDLVSARVGFSPFAKANSRIYDRLRKLAAFRRPPAEHLYNLSEISRLASLSYPTTRKYVNANLDKIAYVDTELGRRYPLSAVDFLNSVRNRPVPEKEDTGLYSLTEVAKRTEISTVTLTSYFKRYNLEPTIVENGRALFDKAFVDRVAEIRKTNRAAWGS